jgi:parvulin-like peptidyl-prolyl isomerase
LDNFGKGDSDTSISEGNSRATAKSLGKRRFYVKAGSIALVLLILIAALLFFKVDKSGNQFTSKSVQNPFSSIRLQNDADIKSDASSGSSQSSASAADEQQNIQPEQVKEVLLKEAEKEGIEVADSDVDKFIERNLDAYQMTKDELQQKLDEAGISYEQYYDAVKTQMAVAEVINRNVDLQNVKVSDSEVDSFIEENKKDLQDFFYDEEDSQTLRSMVKTKLLREKQESIVLEFVKSLE